MIAIIDYGINKTSELTEALSLLGIDYIVTRDEKEIIKCEKVIISNSLSLSKAVKRIHLLNLFSLLRFIKKPTLGIALGMNLLCKRTDDGISCLGLIDTDIKYYTIDNDVSYTGLKKVKIVNNNRLFANIKDYSSFYFSNNYYIGISDYTTAIIEGEPKLSAAIQRDNFYGIRFLPEKSGKQGLQVLKNFAQNII